MTIVSKSILALVAGVTVCLTAATHSFAQDNSDQMVANFLEADANADNALTLSEFTQFIDLNAQHSLGRASTIAGRGLYSRAFSRIDGNGDGLVTTDEMAAMAQ